MEVAIVIMKNGNEHLVTETQGEKLKKFIKANEGKNRLIRLKPEGPTIQTDSIVRILTNAEYQEPNRGSARAHEWVEVLRKNYQTMKETGKWGTIKSPEELTT